MDGTARGVRKLVRRPEAARAARTYLRTPRGGVKGIGLADPYSMLEERGYRPNNAAETSARAKETATVQ
jgi:hypothetical protein